MDEKREIARIIGRVYRLCNERWRISGYRTHFPPAEARGRIEEIRSELADLIGEFRAIREVDLLDDAVLVAMLLQVSAAMPGCRPFTEATMIGLADGGSFTFYRLSDYYTSITFDEAVLYPERDRLAELFGKADIDAIEAGAEMSLSSHGSRRDGPDTGSVTDPYDHLDPVIPGSAMEDDRLAGVGKMGDWNRWPKKFQERFHSIHENRRKIKVDGKWGYMDSRGELVIDACYDNAGMFQNGMAKVSDQSGEHYIYRDGRRVPEPVFERRGRRISENRRAVKLDGKWGFADETDKVVIKPKYIRVGFFCGGKAEVTDEDGPHFVDPFGERTEPPEFDRRGKTHEGRTPVKIGERWGFVDEDDRIVVDVMYKRVSRFLNGVARATDEDGTYALAPNGDVLFEIFVETKFSHAKLHPIRKHGLEGYCNQQCKIVIRPQYDLADHFHEGLAKITSLEKAPTGSTESVFREEWSEAVEALNLRQRVGFIDTSGSVVIPTKYIDARPFSGGVAAVKAANGWTFIDRNDIPLAEATFDDIDEIDDEIVLVRSSGLWGIFNRKLKKLVVEPKCCAIDGKGELLPFQMGSRKGFLNRDGKEVVPAKYDQVECLKHGFGLVMKNELWGLVNRKGNFVTDVEYGEIRMASTRYGSSIGGESTCLFLACQDGLWSLLSAKGADMLRGQYEEIKFEDWRVENVHVKHNGLWGVLTIKGKKLTPIEFDKIHGYSDTLFWAEKEGRTITWRRDYKSDSWRKDG